MESFKEFVNAGAFGNTAEKGYDTQFFGTGKSLNLPTPTLDIPTKIISGRIRSIFYTQNPITIVIENGATWKLGKDQWDYIKSIGKEPREGKHIVLELFLDGTVKSINLF